MCRPRRQRLQSAHLDQGVHESPHTSDTESYLVFVNEVVASNAAQSLKSNTGVKLNASNNNLSNIGSLSASSLVLPGGDVQTQLNGKQASGSYAPLSSPTFSGTVVLPSTTSVGGTERVTTNIRKLFNLIYQTSNKTDEDIELERRQSERSGASDE